MDSISPKDAFVVKIMADDGARVEIGTPILALDFLNEDLRIARLGALENMRKILANRLSPPTSTTNRQLIQVDSDNAGAALPVLQEILLAAQDGVESGMDVEGTDLAVQQLIYLVTQQKSAADLQLKLFDLQMTSYGKINDLVAQQIQQELTAANALLAWTGIAAVNAGTLSLKVTAGRFVRRGDTLFSVL